MSFLKKLGKAVAETTLEYLEEASKSNSKSSTYSEEQRQSFREYSESMHELRMGMKSNGKIEEEESSYVDISGTVIEEDTTVLLDPVLCKRVQDEFVKQYKHEINGFVERLNVITVDTIIDERSRNLAGFILEAIRAAWKVILSKYGKSVYPYHAEFMNTLGESISILEEYYNYEIVEEIRINEDWDYGQKGYCFENYFERFYGYAISKESLFLKKIELFFAKHS